MSPKGWWISFIPSLPSCALFQPSFLMPSESGLKCRRWRPGVFLSDLNRFCMLMLGVSKLVLFYPNFFSFFLFVCTGSCIGFFSPLIAISYY